MAGSKKRNNNLSRDEDIKRMKNDVLSFFEKTGMKTAAANFVGRDIQTIRDWETADEEFRADMLRAKAKFAKDNIRKIRLDNLFANLYPDDHKPPKQEVDATLNHDIRNPDALQRLIESSGFVPAPGQSNTRAK